MKKLFALLMALTMTVQLVTPAWADAVEEPEEPTEVVEEVEETTEATEETEAETTEATEAVETTEEATEKVPEEVTEETLEETAETEPTEETEEGLPEDEVVEDVAALAAGVVASGTAGENLTWVLGDDGVLTVSGQGKMPDYSTSSVAPWYSKRTKITSVVVEPGVTNVGDYAFYACLKLAEVELPEGMSYIGWGAFQDCTKLKAVEIPGGVTGIGEYAFSGCSSLTSVNIPDGITSIEWCAFYGCGALTNVSIPEGVMSIRGYAFSGCSGLTSVNIPEGVTSIEGYAFYGCSSLQSLSIPDSVGRIGSDAFYGCSSLTSVNIPDGVTQIEGFTFYNCSSLESVEIPDSVTSIGEQAFYGCKSLASMSIPEGVTSIGSYAFSGCSGLTSVSIGEDVLSIGDSAFYGCSGLTSITIPEGVTSIEGATFANCTSLESVILPEGLLSIADQYNHGVFENCTRLRSIVIPDSVTRIGSYAFRDCSSLTSVSIGDSVASIGSYAFYGCSGLTSVGIPDSVTSIGRSAFHGCSSLTSITIPEGVTSLNTGTFYQCTSLESIVIPDSVTSIGSSAFYGCSGLTSVSIGDSATSIGDNAFYGCSGLTSVSIGDGVTSIGSYAFYGCSGLTSVSIGDSVTSIGISAFQGCSSLASITIPEGVTSIAQFTFYNCTALTTVGIPASVTNIGYAAFDDCRNLKKVYYGGSEAEWKNIDTNSSNYYLTGAKFIYGRTHECTLTHLPEKAPTCTEKGNHDYYYCPICKKAAKDAEGTQPTTVEAETIPALGHSMEKHEETAATCTTLGNHTYYFCTTCQKAFLDAAGKRETTVKEQTVDALGHAMVLHDTQAATCGKPGNAKYYTCRICGNSYKDYQGTQATTPEAETIPALAHLMVKTEAVDPTCTEPGNNAYYTCATCQKVFKDQQGKQETTVKAETIAALGHSMTLTEAEDPTCTETGNNVYYVCKTCRKVFKDEAGQEETTVKDETLAALGHSMTKTEAATPTCTETGNNAYFICAICHKVFKDEAGKHLTTIPAETLPAIGHTMTKTETVAPTCTEPGNNAYYTCGTCHKVYKDEAGKQETTAQAEIVPALGHTMVKTEAVAPTCTEKGSNAYYTCETCGKVFKDEAGKQETTVEAEVLAALGHSMVLTEAKEPTCTETGNHAYYTCQTCGKVYQDEAGEKATTVAAETIPALGHTMTKTEAVAPTCTEPGNNAYYTCGTCHKVYKDEAGKQETTAAAETVPALGHTMVKTDAVAPTCTEKGSNAYYTCETCGKVFKDETGKQETTVEAEVLEALGHSMVLTEAKEPTCTETGNHAYYTCQTCGKVYQDEAGEKATTVAAETIPALGHTMTKTEAVAPTCTEPGNNAYYTCSTCHKVYKDEAGKQETTAQAEILKALGHDMDKTEAVAPTHTSGGNNAYYTCKTCHKVFRDAQGTTETTPEQEVLPRLPGIADGKSGSLTWILSDEGTLTVSGKGRMPDYSGSALAPWYDYREKITALEVEEGVLSIGAYAFFDCENLAEIQLPGSLKQLGKDCFAGCDSLKLLDMSSVPEKAAEKVIDLQGLVKLDASLEKLVGSNAMFHWELETIQGEADARTLAKLTGSKLEVRHSGKFRLVCTEGYTGLTGSAEMEVQSFTVIRPEDRDRMISGEALELSAWAMPFETELSVRWSLEEDSKAYASISDAGVLTAKAVTEPVDITVLASPVNGEETAEKTIRILPKTVGLSILADGEMTGHMLAVDLTEKRTLTLTAKIQPEGAQTAVIWTSEAPDIASVDDAGTVTLLKPGTAVIRGASADGGASAELTLQVFYLDPAETLTLTAGSVELEQGEKTQLVLSGENAIDPENVLFQIAQSQAQLAEVDAQGVVTAKSAAGKVTVVAALKNDPLMRKAELTLQLLQPRDKSPRLETTALTLNSNLTTGTTTALVESYNNTIQSVTLYDYNKTTKSYESDPSETFTAEAEDGTLTVRALKVQDKGTYQLKLVVDCLGGSYDFTLQVKVANSLPKVTVKQVGKFDTFYLDSTAQLTATAAGCQVERLELVGTDTFRMDEDGNLFYAESYNPGDKVTTKATLQVYLEGYQVPVEKSVTVATTKTAPKLTLNPTASVINTALEEPACRVKVLWNGKALDLTDADVTPDVGFAAVEAQGQYLLFRLTGATGGTAKLSLRLPGWAQAVSLTHKITVDTQLPTVKLGTAALKLNSLFSAKTAQTPVWLTQGNLSIDTMKFVSAKPEGEKITLSFDPETDSIEAKFNKIPEAGTYSYTYTAYLEDGTALPSGTLKVTVAATAPKVKLSAASVKLNRLLAGQEKAAVKVTLTGGDGYRVTDFEGLPEYMDYDADTGNLTVVLPDGTFTGETCTLTPVIRDEESGQEVPLDTRLTLKVQVITGKLSVSLSAKGKLDTVNPDSAMAYTVTKVNNCLGTVDGVDLVGDNADLFQADLDTSGAKPVVLLRLLPGQSYATNKTYKVQFRFTVCGVEVLSPVQSVKVTQTALKVTAPKTAVYYLSQSAPLRCSLTANVPLESVALSAKTAKEFQQALGGEENLRLVGNRLEFRLANPGALTAGKSYTVQLELLPENAAENTKPTTVKLTVKVMK